MALDLNYNTLVTKEDYLQFSGVDLTVELESLAANDIGDDPAPRFIQGIEDWCTDKLKLDYGWNGCLLTEHQTKYYKKGVMYQIQWVLRNGNISNDSGYNMSTGVIVPRIELEKIGMSPNAFKSFRLAGLANIRFGGRLW